MREILFRGKQKNTGDWFYGNLFGKDISGRTHITTTSIGCLNIDPETVGQYTGMTDKNGTKIFEGDIIQFGSQRGSISEVKYLEKNSGFLVKDKWGDWHWLYSICASTNCEVIGNIHDNKELLK